MYPKLTTITVVAAKVDHVLYSRMNADALIRKWYCRVYGRVGNMTAWNFRLKRSAIPGCHAQYLFV